MNGRTTDIRMMPPGLVRLKMVEHGGRRINLWLPLFLLWPLGLFLFLALFPAAAVLVAVRRPAGEVRAVILAGLIFYEIFCAMKGMRVEVDSGRSQVLVVLY